MRRHKARNRRDPSLNGNVVWIEAEAKTTSWSERSDDKRESDHDLQRIRNSLGNSING